MKLSQREYDTGPNVTHTANNVLKSSIEFECGLKQNVKRKNPHLIISLVLLSYRQLPK
jgi:hypothetical protein